jgi:hypothetical protein
LRHAAVPPIGVLAEIQVGIRIHHGNRSSDQINAWLTQAAILEYALAAHPEARAHATIVRDEIRTRRVLAATAAFALGRIDIVRDLSALIEPSGRDWKLSLKMAVAQLPTPAAKAVQKTLVTTNKWLVEKARSE